MSVFCKIPLLSIKKKGGYGMNSVKERKSETVISYMKKESPNHKYLLNF